MTYMQGMEREMSGKFTFSEGIWVFFWHMYRLISGLEWIQGSYCMSATAVDKNQLTLVVEVVAAILPRQAGLETGKQVVDRPSWTTSVYNTVHIDLQGLKSTNA